MTPPKFGICVRRAEWVISGKFLAVYQDFAIVVVLRHISLHSVCIYYEWNCMCEWVSERARDCDSSGCTNSFLELYGTFVIFCDKCMHIDLDAAVATSSDECIQDLLHTDTPLFAAYQCAACVEWVDPLTVGNAFCWHDSCRSRQDNTHHGRCRVTLC